MKALHNESVSEDILVALHHSIVFLKVKGIRSMREERTLTYKRNPSENSHQFGHLGSVWSGIVLRQGLYQSTGNLSNKCLEVL